MSVFAKTPAHHVSDGLARLAHDLRGGVWAEQHQDLLQLTELDIGYRLLLVT